MKPHWEIEQSEADRLPRGDRMVPGDPRILPRRRLLFRFLTEGGVPFTMTR